MYAEALPIDNYQPNFKTYSITVEADSNQNSIEKFGKDFFMRVNFENAKDRANNRLFKLTGKKLSQEKLSLLDNLYSAYINTHILLDFYNDSIKTVFTLDKTKYFVDFDFKKTFALVGEIYNKHYSLKEVELSELNSYIASKL